MPGQQSRPGGQTQAAQKAFDGATAILPEAIFRCASCARVLTADRSLRRGFGPDCWTRLPAVVIGDRRRLVRMQLGALVGAVDGLNGPALLDLASGLADVLDAIGGDR